MTADRTFFPNSFDILTKINPNLGDKTYLTKLKEQKSCSQTTMELN
jgi:hypothetical protein